MEHKIILESEDTLIMKDEHGVETSYVIDAVIEMKGTEFILYSKDEELVVSKIIRQDKGEYLENVTDDELEEIIDAYGQALMEHEPKE
ncbi:DUF1292 domain-containing protein [Aquibacillus koreensis]|uniref:DUF1292 domain-containing protein n=1 Tax=Aquibacillus koreensis TaxID=279446 RepID=A0A9X4AJK6_9BACI|nr:DUF1292 domain-containing protein [Aquibacillus koreensis]MCT2536187.1 DUF1292 domain-containing protein [Aquibacillus koreensis]MDC3422111.1 DUF1292 domain-containing protein [Aquibacillus koreensis]